MKEYQEYVWEAVALSERYVDLSLRERKQLARTMTHCSVPISLAEREVYVGAEIIRTAR